jgi:hypothetical protein
LHKDHLRSFPGPRTPAWGGRHAVVVAVISV